jgi:hypothetical protein
MERERIPESKQRKRGEELDRLIESGGEEQKKRAEKIFRKIVRLLVAEELTPTIIPLERFLELTGAQMEESQETGAPEGACAMLEPGEEEGTWKAYIPDGYSEEEQAKALIHEALHAIFDPPELEEGREREAVERVGDHEKIYKAEDVIWNALKDESKQWLIERLKRSHHQPSGAKKGKTRLPPKR